MCILGHCHGCSAFLRWVVVLSHVHFSHDYPYESSARELLVLVVDCTINSEYLESIKTILRSIVSSYRNEVDIRMSFTLSLF